MNRKKARAQEIQQTLDLVTGWETDPFGMVTKMVIFTALIGAGGIIFLAGQKLIGPVFSSTEAVVASVVVQATGVDGDSVALWLRTLLIGGGGLFLRSVWRWIRYSF